MKHIELFAGIGGFRKAMEGIENDFSIPFQCIGFSEIDANASKTYRANFNTETEVEMGDIVEFNSDMSRYDNLDFDLLTGGFPCQSFIRLQRPSRNDVFSNRKNYREEETSFRNP